MFDRVLNMPRVLNNPWFWMYQSFEYTRVVQGYEYAWQFPEYARLYLKMPEHF